jgi:hypothetical protein
MKVVQAFQGLLADVLDKLLVDLGLIIVDDLSETTRIHIFEKDPVLFLIDVGFLIPYYVLMFAPEHKSNLVPDALLLLSAFAVKNVF